MSVQGKLSNIATDIKNGNLSPDWVAVDSKDILAIVEAFRALEQGKADAETVAENWKQETKIRNSQLDLAVEQRNQYQERAEAAEAKLAEYENRKPDIMISAEGAEAIKAIMNREMSSAGRHVTLKRPSGIDEAGMMGLFTRPAPAVSLAELVPDECPAFRDVRGSTYPQGWNACRAAILRNIEEAK